ncbi:MAG: DUF547 domain-containing protein [Betaproteobacteria bacterium]|nr:DUF547 domain-containing protein [Betaproteobacteria bacterium]
MSAGTSGGRACRNLARIIAGALIVAAVIFPGATAAQFDHSHSAWSGLLKKHLVLIEGGLASQLSYSSIAADRASLKTYLNSLSSVSESEFNAWSKPRRMAFLLNAYNAYTVEKILTRYPNLKSIRDFGAVFGNPWKDRFFRLFGRESWLDHVEHDLLRARGVYDEPRIHFAANCASVGCPMLREEAYVGERLDAQLEEQARRFLSDKSRNRYNPKTGKLEVSRIFDWYKEDWSSDYQGIAADARPIASREQYFTRYAALLAEREEDRRLLAAGKAAIEFLDYDWTLNDRGR